MQWSQKLYITGVFFLAAGYVIFGLTQFLS